MTTIAAAMRLRKAPQQQYYIRNYIYGPQFKTVLDVNEQVQP